jgi:fatty acid amide hydrolase 2
VSAEEVMKTFIQRAKEVNPIINAIVCERYSEALEEAREVDRVLSLDHVPEEYSEASKPFLGVPLSVKECFALKGMLKALCVVQEL